MLRSLADLAVPRRPAHVPYETADDFDARALLTVNGYTTEAVVLIGLLESDLAILQAAAARTLGAQRERSAIDALSRLARDVNAEETARVQAAYALARMDVSGAQDMLVQMLDLSPEATPAPLHAANSLAQLGDPIGFGLVNAALASANPVTAMVACKQLFVFAAFDGQALPGAGVVDAYAAFDRAVSRPEPRIAGEARAQLEALDTEQARRVLAAHAGTR